MRNTNWKNYSSIFLLTHSRISRILARFSRTPISSILYFPPTTFHILHSYCKKNERVIKPIQERPLLMLSGPPIKSITGISSVFIGIFILNLRHSLAYISIYVVLKHCVSILQDSIMVHRRVVGSCEFDLVVELFSAYRFQLLVVLFQPKSNDARINRNYARSWEKANCNSLLFICFQTD